MYKIYDAQFKLGINFANITKWNGQAQCAIFHILLLDYEYNRNCPSEQLTNYGPDINLILIQCENFLILRSTKY